MVLKIDLKSLTRERNLPVNAATRHDTATRGTST